MRILVLQLARLGDILQTLPAIQALKKTHPGSEITLVVRNRFADAARVSPHVDRIVELTTQDILAPCIERGGAEGKRTALERLSAWIGTAFDGTEFDLLVNLTFTEASAWLASIIPARERRGAFHSKDGAFAIEDAWGQYFYAQVLQKNLNILHLNDLFTRIAGVRADAAWPTEINPARVAAIPAGRKIGIQLTSSRPEKSPSIDAWAMICAKLVARTGCDLVFFGAKQDLPAIRAVIGKAVISARSHVVAGSLRFHENAAWLKACERIVSPDTALVHFASICGVPVICIPMGGVRPEETGPYGAGHSVLYPANATPEEFSDEIARVAAGETARNPIPHSRTRLTPCSDGTFRSELVPANFDADETANLFTHAYYLLAEFRCSGRVEELPMPKIGSPSQPEALDRLVLAHDALISIRKTAEFGCHHCLRMLDYLDDPGTLKALSSRVSEVDALLDELRSSVALVKPLLDEWRVKKTNVTGSTLEDLIGLTEGTYRELMQNVDIVLQLLQTAVKAAHEKVGAEKSMPLNVTKEPMKESTT
ncbi:MAG: glycosyltransferase family 9 protein [Deltaproteobacteria bacterium]|nr:glycosyltransferase family 9 protein [Deltaproteobacteria bacterium]